MQDNSVLLSSTKPTTSTENLTTISPTSEPEEESSWFISESSTATWPNTQHTTAESLSGLDFTQQDTTSQQPTLVTTNTDETTNRVPEYVSSSYVVSGTRTHTPRESVSVTNVAETSFVSQSSTVPKLDVVLQSTETSNRLLERDNIVTSETETFPTEKFVMTDDESVIDAEPTVQNSAVFTPDIPDLNGVSRTSTECPSFLLTTPYTPHFHCKESGNFAARPSCVEYHVCM